MSDKPEFDPCLEVIDTEVEKSIDLSEFLGNDAVHSDDYDAHWKEMPEFEQENKKPFKELKVCFQTEEDFFAFQKLLGQPMTRKTKTIWFPEMDREKNSLFEWIEA